MLNRFRSFVVLLSFGALKCASKSKFNNQRIHNNATRIWIDSELTTERCRWIALLLLCTSYICTVHVLSCINAVWTCDDIDSRIHSTIGEVFHLLSAIFLAQGKIHQFHSQPVCFFFFAWAVSFLAIPKSHSNKTSLNSVSHCTANWNCLCSIFTCNEELQRGYFHCCDDNSKRISFHLPFRHCVCVCIRVFACDTNRK